MLYNIFENVKIDTSKEQFEDILKTDVIRIERIISNGQKSVEDFWYDQNENEFILIIQGNAILEFEDKEIKLKKGDCLNIVANKKHRVKYTDTNIPTIWLAIFYK